MGVTGLFFTFAEIAVTIAKKMILYHALDFIVH